MTERAPARHRADVRPSTPLTGFTSTISSVVGDHAATIGRGGVVVAVSGGLVAGMGLPAGAATTGGDAARTASVPLLQGAAGAGAEALASGTVSAPRKARLTFEHDAFTAVAKGDVTTSTPASTTREIATISRSLARAAYRATLPSPRKSAPHAAPAGRATTEPHSNGNGNGNGNENGNGSGNVLPAPPPVDQNASSVVAIALRYLGISYRYGGTTPRGFDCSGFTQYVFRQVGVTLPRTAQQQLHAVTRISRSQARAGDLVFFLGGGYAYHVGIYLGDGKMVDSPRSGRAISVRSIYSANAVFARV